MMINHCTRINILELKDLMHRKIGPKRAAKYFSQLKEFFSLKLTKIEFDKSCIQTIGRENIPLHNRLIRSLLRNASLGQVPPPKVRKIQGPLGGNVTNGWRRGSLQPLSQLFPPSPRKCRSNRDRRVMDRPSPLGPVGKSPGITCDEGVTRTQGQQSPTELNSLGSRPPVELQSVEEGEEVEQVAGSPGITSRSSVTAPLGIFMRSEGTRKAPRCGRGKNYTYLNEYCQESCQLPDTRSLRSCLEQKLEVEGLGISTDCVNLLNNGLDAFLKRLIEPCVQISGSQNGGEHLRSLNGQVPPRLQDESSRIFKATMWDFRVAMELNPSILGEDWSVHLEKICSRATEK